jgi:hypothetical protein
LRIGQTGDAKGRFGAKTAIARRHGLRRDTEEVADLRERRNSVKYGRPVQSQRTRHGPRCRESLRVIAIGEDVVDATCKRRAVWDTFVRHSIARS